MNANNKHTQQHHPKKQNVTTSKAGIKKWSDAKSHKKNGEPEKI